MPKVDTKDAKGAKAGSVQLDDAMFGIEPNIPVMHQVVTAQLAALVPQAGHHAVAEEAAAVGAQVPALVLGTAVLARTFHFPAGQPPSLMQR